MYIKIKREDAGELKHEESQNEIGSQKAPQNTKAHGPNRPLAILDDALKGSQVEGLDFRRVGGEEPLDFRPQVLVKV